MRFWHKHPVFMNFVAIIFATVILGWFVSIFLNYWTRHGDEVTMPQVCGLNVDDAGKILHDAQFEVTLDSIFNNEVAPGTVISQTPPVNSMVKRGGKAYLLYACYSTKKAKVPDFIDGSSTTAISNFKSRGFQHVEVLEVPSDQHDLVLGATYNGLELRPGMELPITARIVIKVAVSMHEEAPSDSINPEDADAQFIESMFEDDAQYGG